ncbi:expp1 protein [Anaeramoeba ignava]|uniref:Expp1 protein n=1 Tax=Anaeramoeba ignava TaxID=1746090 RepID=A0A9Q0LGV1_ANAIG|nr:expp1 protein [Anaeramoeba ignava]
MKFFLLFFLIISQILAKYCEDTTCQQEIYDTTSYKVGDDSCVFIHVENSTHETRAIFYPIVDQLSILNIPGSGCEYGADVNTTVYISINGINSTKVHVYDTQSFIGSYTVFIKLDQGKVEKLMWDDSLSCSDCNGGCIDGLCALKVSDYNKCYDESRDIKVFVAWIGRDSDKRYLTSSNSVPSRFQRYGVSSAISKASEVPNTI